MAPAPYVFRGGSWVKILAVKRILLPFLLVCASLLSAQTRKPPRPAAPSASKLISIRATGSTRYTPAQIAAATGLRLGQVVTDDDFKEVSRHLGETGAFNNVAYTFQFNPEGIKLDLQVTDSEPFVPVRFENFVWLSDKELYEKLSAREPLFQGQLPVSGNLADQVSEDLQGLAIEHNLHGRVDYLRAGPQDGPMEAFEFSIAGQPIVVRSIDFSGAGPAELPLLEVAARRLFRQDYSHSRLILQADKNFLPVFLEHGYLKAKVGEPKPKVVEETPEETSVNVTFAITPGLQYKAGEVQLSGYTNIFPVEKLRGLIHQQPGQTANAIQVDQDVEALKKLYGTRGYMGVQIHPATETNDGDSTVKYVFEFKEGGIYKMGDLEVRGLDSKATERIGADWKLLPGQTYNSDYPGQFLASIAGTYPADQWKITLHETPEDQDKVVDVSLHFDPIR
jgi:outer membrane protein assembly factor BamA